MKYLLDTNVISEPGRPKPDARVLAWLAETDEDAIFLSVATIAEIRNGIELMPQGKRRNALIEWLETDLPQRFERRILEVSFPIADIWGALIGRTARRGRNLQVMDALIAATAIAHELTIVTRNARDFAGLGVPLFDPWKY